MEIKMLFPELNFQVPGFKHASFINFGKEVTVERLLDNSYYDGHPGITSNSIKSCVSRMQIKFIVAAPIELASELCQTKVCTIKTYYSINEEELSLYNVKPLTLEAVEVEIVEARKSLLPLKTIGLSYSNSQTLVVGNLNLDSHCVQKVSDAHDELITTL